jgi:FkbM family methyltransferase
MQELNLESWSDWKWLSALRHHYMNWPSAAVQMVSFAESKRPEIRLLQHVTRRVGLEHDVWVRFPDGSSILTSDAMHLAGLLEHGWRARPEGEFLRMESPTGVRILVRPIDACSRDLCSLFEINIRGDYGASFDGMTVVDIGAGDGDSALHFAAGGARQVIAVEPDYRNAGLIRRNLMLNPGLGQIVLREGAVTVNARTLDLEISNRYRRSGEPGFAEFRRVRVPGYPVEELLSSLDRVDLLKVDVEGAEYEILGAIGPSTWERISGVAMEFHSGLGPLPELFRSNGFAVTASLGVRQGLLFANRSERSAVRTRVPNGA